MMDVQDDLGHVTVGQDGQIASDKRFGKALKCTSSVSLNMEIFSRDNKPFDQCYGAASFLCGSGSG
jgi:hypothetical protein